MGNNDANGYSSTLTSLLVALGLAILPTELVSAQLIPDSTLGAESSVVQPGVNVRGGAAERIEGGAARGANLFHSFADFNVKAAQRVYFANPAGIENIVTRVTGSAGSEIRGLLGIDGGANLFLLNPNGILFGPNAQLDIAGSFVASTASSFKFADGSEFSATDPNAPPLLTVKLTPGLQYGASRPGATIASTGPLTVGGDLTLVADGISLKGQVQAGRDLTLQAADTVVVRDEIGRPFRASAGRNLRVEAGVIDILALNPTQAAFQSGGDLTMVSDNNISGDAHFVSNGNFSLLTRSGAPADFVSFEDPIISANGDVTFGNYTGVALKVEATGSITGGNIRITGPDTGPIPISDPHFTLLTTSRALVLQAGKPMLDKAPPDVLPTTTGGTSFTDPGSTSSPGNIRVRNIDTSVAGFAVADGGPVILEAAGDIQTGNITTQTTAILGGDGGDVTATAGNNLQTGQITTKAIGISGDGGRVDLRAGGNVQVVGIDTESQGFSGDGGNISITSLLGGITTTVGLTSRAQSAFGDGGEILFNAPGNITTEDLNSASNTQQAGNIIINSTNGTIRNFSSDAGSGFGNGGNVTFKAGQDIYTGEIETNTFFGGPGGNISLRSGGQINTQAGRLNTFSINAAGNVVLEAGTDLLVGEILTASVNGGAGSMSLIGHEGQVQTTTAPLNAGSVDGSGGAIHIEGEGGIALNAPVVASGNLAGGTLSLISNRGGVEIRSAPITTASRSGSGGNVQVRAAGDIRIRNSGIDTSGRIAAGDQSLTSFGGAIDVNNAALVAGFLPTTAIDLALASAVPLPPTFSFSDFDSLRGAVAFSAKKDIVLQNTFVGTGGETRGTDPGVAIAFKTDSTLALNRSFIRHTATLSTNDSLQFEARNLSATSSGIFSRTRESARAGSLNLNVAETIRLDGTFVGIQNQGPQANGNLNLKAKHLILDNGAIVSTSDDSNNPSYRGGNLTAIADVIEINGTSPAGRFPSMLASVAINKGRAGDLKIQANQLKISKGGTISTASLAQGAGGDITVDAADIRISGTSPDGILPSSISADTYDTGRAGSITVNAQQVTAELGGVISASNLDNSAGGSITVNAANVTVRGTSPDGQIKSSFSVGSFSAGDAGSINIATETLKVEEDGRISVNSDPQSEDASNLLAKSRAFLEALRQVPELASLIPVSFTITSETGKGDAGDLRIKATNILLDRGLLTAITSSGEGGNINLQVQEILFLRRNSLISTDAGTAGAGGNGGNINIIAKFIVAVPGENSDIAANAFEGRGGNIRIQARAILGLQFRKKRTPKNDITASSEFGPAGSVDLNLSAPDPSNGLATLPSDPGVPAPLEGCQQSGNRRNSQFIHTGRIGLPDTPLAPLNDNTVVEDLQPSAQLGEILAVVDSSKPGVVQSPTSIVEARSWKRNHRGNVVLVASTPEVPSPVRCELRLANQLDDG